MSFTQNPTSAQPENGAQPTNGATDAQTFTFSRFNSKLDNTPKPQTRTWRQIVGTLKTRAIRETKDGPLISGASYPTGKTRANENADFISLAILDFDGGATLPEIQSGVASLNSGDGAAAVIYSTFSHTPDAPKFRLVLPLASPVAATDWPDVWRRLALHFGNAPDRSAKDAARVHYLPSCPKAGEPDAVLIELDGGALDVSTLPELPAAPEPAEPTRPAQNAGADFYAQRAFENEIDRLATTTGNRNDALNKASRRLGQFVGAFRLNRSDVESALLDACRSNGYIAKDGESAARSTMKSGLDAGEKEPNYNKMPDDRRGDFGDSNQKAPNNATPDDDDRAPETKKAAAPFEVFTFAQMATLPRPNWLIRGLLVEQTTSVLSADGGSFKSFFALEMALCIATGTPFHGREVKRGNVVYIAAEGFYTLFERATAWAQRHGVELPENFHILRAPVNLSDARAVADFVAHFKELAPDYAVFDTLSQNALGLNENSNDEMARFMAGMARVGRELGAHVQTVHHNSKATGTFRGAGAIKNNVDTHITLERPENDDQNTVFIRCEKQRGKPFEPFALRGVEIVLPFTDEFGDEITSLVFEECGDAVAPKNEKHPNTKKADKTRDALMGIFDQCAIEGEPFGGVKVGFWKEAVEQSDPKICDESSFWRHLRTLKKEEIEECGTHNGSAVFKRKGTPTVTTVTTVKSSSDSKPPDPESPTVTTVTIPLGSDSSDSSDSRAKNDSGTKAKKRTKKADSEPYGNTPDANSEKAARDMAANFGGVQIEGDEATV